MPKRVKSISVPEMDSDDRARWDLNTISEANAIFADKDRMANVEKLIKKQEQMLSEFKNGLRDKK